MPTTQTRWLPSGALEQTILYHPSEARQLFACPGADLAPSCLTPTEGARAQTNGQLVAPSTDTLTEAPSVPVVAPSAPGATPEPATNPGPPRGLSDDAGETVLDYLARTAQEAGLAWDTAECEAALVMLDKSQIPAHVPVERWHTALGRCAFAWLGAKETPITEDTTHA